MEPLVLVVGVTLIGFMVVVAVSRRAAEAVGFSRGGALFWLVIVITLLWFMTNLARGWPS
jgi:hypothetical protein